MLFHLKISMSIYVLPTKNNKSKSIYDKPVFSCYEIISWESFTRLNLNLFLNDS